MTKKLLISIVDDDQIHRFAMKIYLRDAGLHGDVIDFNDGEEALNFMVENMTHAEKMPDIIFLDINMPIMDGFEFMHEFIKIRPKVGKEVLVYMVSSSVNSSDIRRAKSISAISDYIIKPVSHSKLKDILRNLKEENNW